MMMTWFSVMWNDMFARDDCDKPEVTLNTILERINQMSMSIEAELLVLKQKSEGLEAALEDVKVRDQAHATALEDAKAKIADLTAKLEAAPEDNSGTQQTLAEISAILDKATATAATLDVDPPAAAVPDPAAAGAPGALAGDPTPVADPPTPGLDADPTPIAENKPQA